MLNVQLSSADPFHQPRIDPRYGSNPADLEVLLAAIMYLGRLLTTEPMQLLQPDIDLASFEDPSALLQQIKAGVMTMYHPSCSCPMLPRRLGGVVDPELLVYGTQNLRIADASIMPMIPAGHLQAIVYGIAEKVRGSSGAQSRLTVQAADIIKEANRPANTSNSFRSCRLSQSTTQSPTGSTITSSSLGQISSIAAWKIPGMTASSDLRIPSKQASVFPSTSTSTSMVLQPGHMPVTTHAAEIHSNHANLNIAKSPCGHWYLLIVLSFTLGFYIGST